MGLLQLISVLFFFTFNSSTFVSISAIVMNKIYKNSEAFSVWFDCYINFAEKRILYFSFFSPVTFVSRTEKLMTRIYFLFRLINRYIYIYNEMSLAYSMWSHSAFPIKLSEVVVLFLVIIVVNFSNFVVLKPFTSQFCTFVWLSHCFFHFILKI